VFPVLESLTTLTYLSASTSKLKLGSSVLIMSLRRPLVLAKTLSALQIYSDGRLVLGAATGWYEREFKATGVDFSKRGQIFEEQFQLVRKLLYESDVNYAAETVKIDHATILPKSTISIPMLIGGYSDRVLDRAGRLSDGWVSYYYGPEDFRVSWSKVRASAARVGRDSSKLISVDLVPLAISHSFEHGESLAKDFTSEYMDLPKNTKCTPESSIRGTTSECVEQIRKFEEAGLEELVLIPSHYQIEQVERAGKEILPSFLK
jgi:alkanesulfonate monooxygenase SsuD/methylene tetrahydromethanopterin reductase-like flavin-dependent oxidoreductase (luciferase family)